MDLSFATASELAAAIAAGELASRELLEHQLARIDALNPALGAVVTVDDAAAHQAASAADEATARGESWGPLHGVTMTVKDVYETAGTRTTAGANDLAEHVPDTDATTVARLRAAGAVIVGKTNTPPYAGDDQTFNDLFGRTSNPWDTARSPGGSSGGSAAALAAGLTPLELGSDIGGSIRAPSHFCGTHGFKPSWGTVPDRGHIPGPPGSLVAADVNCCGPMARDVEDLRLGFDVLAGPPALDAPAWSLRLPEPDRLEVGGLRVALTLEADGFPVADEVATAIRAFVDRLADAGATVTEAPLPVPLRELHNSWIDLVIPLIGADLPDAVFAEFAPLADLPESDIDPADSLTRAGRAMGLRFRHRHAADQRRQRHRQRWAAHFEHHDVVLAPVMPTAAFLHDERPMMERTLDVDGVEIPHLDVVAWCGGVGTCLLPVAVVPVGLTPAGLPVGVQVIGPWLGDLAVLEAAALLDDLGDGFVAPPLANG